MHVALFYTKNEVGLRMAYWFSFAAVAGAFGGLIAFGIQHVHAAIANWRLLFIIEGIPTIVLGVISFFLLPDRPEGATYLTKEERHLAAERMNRGTSRDIGATINKKHIWAAFLDWRIYVAGLIYFGANCALASISAFLPTIIKTFGYTNALAQLLTVPPYAVAALVMTTTSYTSDRMQSRGGLSAGASIVGGFGYILLLSVPHNQHIRYFATFLITSGTYTTIGLVIAWFAHNLGSETKKATGIPMYMAIGQCGSVLGSHLFPTTDGPRYVTGFADALSPQMDDRISKCHYSKTPTTIMTTEAATREALTSREIPQMTLSEASNPLTAPLPTLDALQPTDRAVKRFAVEGNAIITGGTGGLGIYAARALLDHGASGLSMFDILPAMETVEALRLEYPSAKIIVKAVDVRDAQAIDAAVLQTAQELGSVDMLLCFAGVVGCAQAAEVDGADWKRVIDINTTGSWLCAQSVGKHMIQQDTGGSIVFTASISAHRVNFPQPQVAYNVSKGALLQLKNSLAAEWARYGIRVNSISPGYMDTILNEGDGLEPARKIWRDRNPMGRMGQPAELTGPIVLLCSAAGRYINGADIVVDGESGG
ncbi:hypothetical protein HWV62_37753 [Athelia sp. TMB]|nr:hypothetical protein HWV62_37753 [Athelia sp. TMB]